MVGRIGGTGKDMTAGHWLQLEDVSKGIYSHTSKGLLVLLDLLEPQVQHIQHVSLDKGDLVDDDSHQVLQLLLLPVSVPVPKAGEVVPIPKVEGAGQRPAPNVAGSCASEGSQEDVGLVWGVAWLLEDAGCPLCNQIDDCGLACMEKLL